MQNENAILSAQTITQSHKAFGINIQSKALHIEEMETYIVQSSIIQNIVEMQKIYKTHIAFKNITYNCFTS